MTQYNNLNVKLFNLELSKLKSGIKNGTEVTLILLWNMIVNFNNETNVLHKYYLLIHKLQGFVKLLRIIHQLI